jgi:hypothetical protein
MHQKKFVLLLFTLATACIGCTPEITSSPSPSVLKEVSKEVEARELVNSILFDQKAYYIGNEAFTTSTRNLPATNASMESPNYKYQIRPKPDKRKGIAVTATSKRPNLRSFTGVVFVLNKGKEKMTMSEICETTKPSKTAPNPPAMPKRATEQIQCPAGSRSAMAVLALQP